MRIEPREARPESRPWDDLKHGFAYVGRHPEIRSAIALSMMTGFFGMSFLALVPAYARDILHRGSDALGFVMSGFGIGAFVGAVTATRLQERHLALVPIVMAAVFGVALACFANVHTLPLAILAIVPGGFSYLLLTVSNNTRMQILVDDAMRGRVMAFYAMGALGCPPLGALMQGYIAGHFGVPTALMLGAVACIGASAISYRGLRRRTIRAKALESNV
jgi:predicted MFS family arabinose efflux permease